MRSGLIILGIIACLFASGCKQDAWKNLNKAEAALWMLKDSSDQVAYWYLCHLYDPYQGGKVIPADSASRKILEIHRDGRFVIQNRESQLEGRWKLNQARTEILFISKARNGVKLKQQDPQYRQISQLRKVTQDTMILAWQGRHGYVEEFYAKNCQRD